MKIQNQKGFLHFIVIFVVAASFITAGGITIAKRSLSTIPNPTPNVSQDQSLQILKELKAKAQEYQQKGATTSGITEKLPEITELIASNQYDLAKERAASLSAQLDSVLQQKQEEDRLASEAAEKKRIEEEEAKKKAEEEAKKKAEEEAKRKAAAAAAAATAAVAASTAPQPVAQVPAAPADGASHARITVGTEVGNFTIDVITAEVGKVRVITDAGSSGNCDTCEAMPLASYISRNGGFAGMNGTYFCPPDYSNCAGKAYSFSWFVFSNTAKTFLNADKRDWGNAGGLFIFRPGSVDFQRSAASFGLDTGISGAIASWPAILVNGGVQDDPLMDDKQRTVKGNRGGMCARGNTIRLIVARSATVRDLGFIMKALGCDNGINLDGGGSSAMYFNGYKVGPGRQLPNAIILAR